MQIGKNTPAGKDLLERAEKIIGLEREAKGLQAQAKEIKEQISDAYGEAASEGYSKPVLRQVIKEMMMEPDKRQLVFEFESEVDVYRHALGLIDDEAGEPTISINGGPAHPMSAVKAVVQAVQAARETEPADA